MNILIVANHYAVCSARYATDAFTRLGHTVRHVGPAMGRNIWGLTLPEQYVWEPDDIVATERDFDADLYVVMDSDPRLLDSLKPEPPEYTKPVVIWGVDNHVRSYRRDWFDHYFLAHRHTSVMEWEKQIASSGPTSEYADVVWSYNSDGMTHVPCCYDPTLHTPSPIPYAEREYDVACLGVMYPVRANAVKVLQAAGLKVIWGSGLVFESYRDAYHNARISLCLSARVDVAQRVFETAAMGNVVMSDNCRDYQILKPNGFYVLEPGEEYVDAVRSVLSDPDAAQEQIKESVAWVKPHTWDARAQQIVEWYEGRKDD